MNNPGHSLAGTPALYPWATMAVGASMLWLIVPDGEGSRIVPGLALLLSNDYRKFANSVDET